jgi:F-type H+-transporting ATPase subunit delta
MKVNKQAKREAKELFRSCQTSGVLDEARTREAVQRVLQAKPRGYISILSHFQRLVKLDQERRTVRVESATPLTPALQADVQARLGRAYGAGLNVAFSQNPALIGGLRIRVGFDVYDGSIQARLEALEQNF